MAPAGVLACGLATVDVVQTVERVPGANQKVVALGTRVEAGGPALNAAVTAALLGMPARLVTGVGRSALGAVVRDDCAAHGVDLVDTAGEGFDLPVSTVLVTASTGERAVVSRNAAGAAGCAVPAPGRLAVLLEGVQGVLVDGHHLPVAVAVAAAARERGIPVLADAGSWKPGLETLLAHVDVLVASADLRAPSGPGLPDLLALGPGWVARTAGGSPVEWLSADGSGGWVSVPDVEVVDTLGAGDVLHGALLADLARHGPSDLPGSLRRAVEVAARSVTADGARGWAGRGA
ncbi:MAG TPA: PfkB family carbohydrate kinase [Ornithinibacter sp.]|nr:PfkB family carbohydrate kinase [Ornithinibacter sp.]